MIKIVYFDKASYYPSKSKYLKENKILSLSPWNGDELALI